MSTLQIRKVKELSIPYVTQRTLTVQYIVDEDNKGADLIDTNSLYDCIIFVGRQIDTTNDELITQSEEYAMRFFKSNSKKNCKYYVLFEEARENYADTISLAFNYIESYFESKKVPYRVCLDFELETPKKELWMNEFTEMFFACAHWCRLLEFLQEVVLNGSKLNIFQQKVITNHVEECVQKYSDLKNLVFENSADQEAFNQMCKDVESHIQNMTSKPKFLNENELFAIVLYSSNFYRVINRVLRNPQTEKKTRNTLLGVFTHIDTGLWHYTQYKGIAWRGDNLSASRLEENEPGKKVTNLAYTSTSIGTDTDFAKTSSQIFEFQLIDGSSISGESMYPEEGEILLKAKMQYLVNDNTKEFKDTGKPLYEVTEQDTLRR